MVERSIAFAAEAMAGTLAAGDAAAAWNGAALDSRRVGGGEIFFALPGERVDGHDYVEAAVERGAAAVVVHRPVDTAGDAARLRVEDTFAAFHDLTRAVRAQVPRRLVGITGSAGKTTTKELLAAMLGRRFRVARSPGNLNNLYGFPLALLNIADGAEWMVAEMGMSTPGELGGVSRLGRPDVAVFTNVRPAHLASFADLGAITEAKAELLDGLAADGLVVANADDPEVMRIAGRHRGRRVLYALEDGPGAAAAEVLASAPAPLGEGRDGYRFELTAPRGAVEVELPLHGLVNVENCLAAAACADALGVPLREIAAAVAGARPGDKRGEVHHLASGLSVVDDCYNSNPDAACRALESARRLPARRHVAVLGDMLELGDAAPRFHRQVGERAASLGFARVVAVGELADEIASAAEAGGAACERLADARAAAAWAAGAVRGGELGAGDLVLVKGSRGIGLEAAVAALLGEEGG